MTIEKLCERIHLQEPVLNEVRHFLEIFDVKVVRGLLEQLKQPDTCELARIELEKVLAPDEGQIGMLTCMLLCAAESYDIYMEWGISDTVFDDTMKCFSRFIKECEEKTGKYTFDRAFWTVRQIGMRLFRIGSLEYELIDTGKDTEVSIHIPSDADLSENMCEASLQQANDFIKNILKGVQVKRYVCNSWLLSPTLKLLLPNESKILKFQRRFEIIKQYPEGTAYMEWVYPGACGEVQKLPERTSLQKGMKEYLLSGGKVGEAEGVLREK